MREEQNARSRTKLDETLGRQRQELDESVGHQRQDDQCDLAQSADVRQICLLNTAFFGVMATLMTWLVFPNLQRLFAKVPHDVMTVISLGVYVFFALVVCMYVINFNLMTNITL